MNNLLHKKEAKGNFKYFRSFVSGPDAASVCFPPGSGRGFTYDDVTYKPCLLGGITGPAHAVSGALSERKPQLHQQLEQIQQRRCQPSETPQDLQVLSAWFRFPLLYTPWTVYLANCARVTSPANQSYEEKRVTALQKRGRASII